MYFIGGLNMDFNLNLDLTKLSKIFGQFHELQKVYKTERLILQKETTPDSVSNVYSILLRKSKEQIGIINVLYDGELWSQIYEDFRHNGYATEAVSKLINSNISKNFYFVIDFRNKPSRKVAKRLGFKRKGRNGKLLIYRKP